jgi:hypothetical protein
MWYLSSNPTTILSCITTVLVIIFTIFIFSTKNKMVISFFMHAKKANGGRELPNPHPGRYTLGKMALPLNRRLVPQAQSGCFRDDKNIWSLLGTDHNCLVAQYLAYSLYLICHPGSLLW